MLIVDQVNYAYKMYRKFSFEFVKAKGESVTLVKKLNTENELGAFGFQKKESRFGLST